MTPGNEGWWFSFEPEHNDYGDIQMIVVTVYNQNDLVVDSRYVLDFQRAFEFLQGIRNGHRHDPTVIEWHSHSELDRLVENTSWLT